MNLSDSLRITLALFGAHLGRHRPSKHIGSKPPRLSDAAIKARRKAERQARRRQQAARRAA